MLSLTHAARQLISGMLAESPQGTVLRISANAREVEICKDRVREGDSTFNEDGKCVLAIDQMVVRKLTGRTIDIATINGKPVLTLADVAGSDQSGPT